ncbi:hypothetical protein Tco_1022271 [Tanacetum coccineum]
MFMRSKWGVRSAKVLTSTKNVLSRRKSNRWRRLNMGNLADQLRSTEIMEQNTVTTNEIPSSTTGQCKVVNDDLETQHKSFSSITLNNKEGWTTKDTQCQLPPKELNLGNFTLPCTIGKFNFYGMADLGASVNVMPRNIFEYLRLANMWNTNMLVEMADMRKKAPLCSHLEGSLEAKESQRQRSLELKKMANQV